MILKIAQYDDGPQIMRWKYIDNIAEVSTFNVFLKKAIVEDDGPEVLKFFATRDGDDEWKPDLTFIPRIVEETVLSGSTDARRVSAVMTTSREGNGRLIAFHEAYLMNDEGKTIERL